jgi:hypothetical protein
MSDLTEKREDPLAPDTLDLAEHGRLAINGLLGTTNPAVGYENYFLTFFDVHPAYMIHWSSQVSGVLPKYVEAMPLLRLMTGSDQQQETEQAMLASVVHNMEDDGLIYDRATPDRPWNSAVGYGIQGWNEDYANMAGNGRLLRGLLHYYHGTSDDLWRRRAQRTAERMLELAIVKDDYAYYPNVGLGNDYSYPRISGWIHTREPQAEFEGSEGTMLFYLLQPVRGLTRWYVESGDERFLQLSRRFVRLAAQRRFWGGLNDVEPSAGAERGHFFGHYHGHLAALIGLLDYARVANDWRLKLFVRDAYEWARHHGIHRLGIFPGGGYMTEGCTVADMTALAAGLTDAGAGDYWDDVDQYARNGLLSVQAYDADEMRRVSECGRERPPEARWGGHDDPRFEGYGGVLPGQETTDRAIERSLGSFGFLVGARYLYPRLMHCCTGNGSQALYYAWDGIVRQSGDGADVNLWLNRRTPWLDVWSWLPYAGKLVVQNRGMRRLSIRAPGWAAHGAMRCQVDGHDVTPAWSGNRILFNGLAGNEEITLTVPVALEKTQYTMANLNHREGHSAPDHYDCEFKGNTVISVGDAGLHPGGQQRDWYRLFHREQYRADEAPLKPMTAYVHPDKVIRW